MSYAMEVIADDSGKWVGNSVRFADEDQATAYAKDLFSRWMAVRQTRVVESADPVNYRFDASGLTAVEQQPIERSLSTIARDISQHWASVYFGAVPYLHAMRELDGMDDKYGLDDASSIVRYFLSNATGWRGEHARRIKVELKAMLKGER